MFFVQVADVSFNEALNIIHAALGEQGVTHKELVKKIGYPFERRGLEDLEMYFSGTHPHEMQVRTKIGNALGIDHETLTGEREFENKSDAKRFSFVPYLVRVPENTRPSQITIFGFFGFNRAFIAGRYRSLLHKPLEDHLDYIKIEIQNDTEFKGNVPFFGLKLGYAYYWNYDQPAIAFSVDGELLHDTIVTYSGESSCSVTLKASVIIESGGFRIPRFTPMAQAEGDNHGCD